MGFLCDIVSPPQLVVVREFWSLYLWSLRKGFGHFFLLLLIGNMQLSAVSSPMMEGRRE